MKEDSGLEYLIASMQSRKYSEDYLLTQKINTLESEGTVRQVSESRPSVPVNLTCKLTRNWQMLVSRVYRLDFQITLAQVYRQAVPIEKTVKGYLMQ